MEHRTDSGSLTKSSSAGTATSFSDEDEAAADNSTLPSWPAAAKYPMSIGADTPEITPRSHATTQSLDSNSDDETTPSQSALSALSQLSESGRRLWERLQALFRNTIMRKYGRRGQPKFKYVACSAAGDIHWSDAILDLSGAEKDDWKPSTSSLSLQDVIQVVIGKETEVFNREVAKSAAPEMCFSLVTPKRTLDLECRSPIARDAWVKALEYCVQAAKKDEANPKSQPRFLKIFHRAQPKSRKHRSKANAAGPRIPPGTSKRGASIIRFLDKGEVVETSGQALVTSHWLHCARGRLLWDSADKQPGSNARGGIIAEEKEEHPSAFGYMRLNEIKEVLLGQQENSPSNSSTRPQDYEQKVRCFTVVGANQRISFKCASEVSRRRWFRALTYASKRARQASTTSQRGARSTDMSPPPGPPPMDMVPEDEEDNEDDDDTPPPPPLSMAPDSPEHDPPPPPADPDELPPPPPINTAVKTRSKSRRRSKKTSLSKTIPKAGEVKRASRTEFTDAMLHMNQHRRQHMMQQQHQQALIESKREQEEALHQEEQERNRRARELVEHSITLSPIVLTQSGSGDDLTLEEEDEDAALSGLQDFLSNIAKSNSSPYGHDEETDPSRDSLQSSSSGGGPGLAGIMAASAVIASKGTSAVQAVSSSAKQPMLGSNRKRTDSVRSSSMMLNDKFDPWEKSDKKPLPLSVIRFGYEEISRRLEKVGKGTEMSVSADSDPENDVDDWDDASEDDFDYTNTSEAEAAERESTEPAAEQVDGSESKS